MVSITVENPQYLWFLVFIPILIVIHYFSLRFIRRRALKFANFDAIERVTGDQILSTNTGLLVIQILIISLFVFSATAPTLWYEGQASAADYVIAIDASSSMTANDIEPSRIEAAKDAAVNFVENLPANSHVGVVSFAGASTVNSQLSENMEAVVESIKNMNLLSYGGTDMGDAMITATNLFVRDMPKQVILLSDGQANIGISLEKALNYVNNHNVIVHTIGVGTDEGGQFSHLNITLKLDEESLRTIADKTGGKYFRATTRDSLYQAYDEILSVEEKKISVPLGTTLLMLSLLLLILEWILVNTKYRTLP